MRGRPFRLITAQNDFRVDKKTVYVAKTPSRTQKNRLQRKNSLPKQSCLEDIYNYGLILKEVLAVLPTKMPHLKHIADRCTDNNPRRRYQDVQELRLAIERRSSNSIYTAIIIFIVIMSILLAWLNSRNSPEHKQENVAIEATK